MLLWICVHVITLLLSMLCVGSINWWKNNMGGWLSASSIILSWNVPNWCKRVPSSEPLWLLGHMLLRVAPLCRLDTSFCQHFFTCWFQERVWVPLEVDATHADLFHQHQQVWVKVHVQTIHLGCQGCQRLCSLAVHFCWFSQAAVSVQVVLKVTPTNGSTRSLHRQTLEIC